MARTNGGLATQDRPANGVANRPTDEAKLSIRSLMEASADRLAAALPKHMTPERITQVVSTLVYRTPKLQECHPHSIFAAVLRACSLGLDLEPAMNEAFLIPRWNNQAKVTECQFQPGYQGLRKLACNSGQVEFIQARVIHAGDHFQYAYNPDLIFSHVPCRGGERGKVTDIYAYAKLASGDQLIEVMSRDEIEAIRARSQSANSGPWVTDWSEMGKKTVIKRLCKSLPRSLDLARAIEADDEDYQSGNAPQVRLSPGGNGRGVAALVGRLEEPEFSANQGVERPVYSEADETPPANDDLPPGRQPGED